MAARLFFAWSMFQAAKARDDRNYNNHIEARARITYDPLLGLTERKFKETYRLTKKVFKRLCNELRRHTNLKSSQRVTLEHKVLTALFFYATGSYQRPVGVAKHLCQKMCSVYIEEITKALTHIKMIHRYIRFPDTPAARQAVSQRFYRNYRMPGVVGCIDGSHFKIVVPSKEVEHWYYSRKHYHSLNVQMVCDDQYRILNVNPKFGGANHDSFIWENSDLNNYMQSLHHNGEMVWLLGDSGYPQRPWLMTPIADARNTAEERYNEIHMKTRVLIENTFSRLKNRWRCLHKDRVLHYKPLKCARIILACSVLHNLGLRFGIGIDDTDEGTGLERSERQSNENENVMEREATSDLIRGRIIRDQLVRRLQ